MTAVLLLMLVPLGLSSVYGEILIRVRLTRADASREKLAWWTRAETRLLQAYEELDPHSRLPIIRRCAFWLPSFARTGRRRRPSPHDSLLAVTTFSRMNYFSENNL